MRNSRLLLPLLLGVFALLIGLMTFLSGPSTPSEPFANRSVFNSGPSGYRAWLLANQKTGLPVTPWQKPFNLLHQLPEPATMIIVEPYTVAQAQIIFGRQEAEDLLDWVAEGNTLILLDDFKRFGSNHLLRMLGFSMQARKEPTEPLPLGIPNRPSLLRSFVREPLVSQSANRFRLEERGHFATRVLLQDDRERPALIRVQYGEGTLVLGTPVDLASNRYLHAPPNDNHQFLTNVLVMERKPVFINEFVHGYREIEDIFAWYRQNTPLGQIFTQLIFAFALALWLSFVRWTPKPPEETARPAPAEGGIDLFVRSLAGIYARHHAAPMILKPQLDQLENWLRQHHQVGLDEESRLRHLLADLAGEYSSRDESPESLLAALRKARDVVRNEQRLSHRELLKLVRQLTSIHERFQYGYREPGTRRLRR